MEVVKDSLKTLGRVLDEHSRTTMNTSRSVTQDTNRAYPVSGVRVASVVIGASSAA